MAWDDQVGRNELQAQAAEVEDLRDEVMRNRTNQQDRARLGRTPKSNEGRDGDSRFVKKGGNVYLYYRVGGSWYKVRLERG